MLFNSFMLVLFLVYDDLSNIAYKLSFKSFINLSLDLLLHEIAYVNLIIVASPPEYTFIKATHGDKELLIMRE